MGHWYGKRGKMYKTVQISCFTKVFYVTAYPCVSTSVPLTYVWAFGFVGCIFVCFLMFRTWSTPQICRLTLNRWKIAIFPGIQIFRQTCGLTKWKIENYLKQTQDTRATPMTHRMVAKKCRGTSWQKLLLRLEPSHEQFSGVPASCAHWSQLKWQIML